MKRRDFFKGGIAAATAVAASRRTFAFPMLFAGSAVSYRANETVQIAAIGAAGRAVANINGLSRAGGRIIGLCDVDTRRVGPMLSRFKNAPFFRDWRKMLDMLGKDVDAVTIGVPDHWHARMAIECLARGKHVQCEKPICQSFDEVDDVLAAAGENPRLVTQSMNQGHAYDTIRDFREWVEAGLIGDVTEAHMWCPGVYCEIERLKEIEKDVKVPDELDWERWQGPVPRRKYSPRFVPGRWRFWTSYGSSTLGDWSCHLMDPVFWTLGLGLPESVKVDTFGSWDPTIHGLTFPKGARSTFTFRKRKGGKFKLVWHDGIACKEVPVPELWKGECDMFPPCDSAKVRKTRKNMSNGAFVYGEKGVIEYGSHGANYLRLLPDTTLEKLKSDGGCPKQKYLRIPDKSPYKEFISAVKGGSKVGSDFAYAGAMVKSALLGIAALFDPGKELMFDRKTQRFTNSSAANTRLSLPRIKA
jgi:predicted dehydrogenase